MLLDGLCTVTELCGNVAADELTLELEEQEARRASLECDADGATPPHDPPPPPSDAELSRRIAEDEAARRPGHEVFRVACPASREVVYVAARNSAAAYRCARRQGFPRTRRGAIVTEAVWGDYSIERRVGRFFVDCCTVRARSAAHALDVARRLHPGEDLRPASLWSKQAYRLLAA